MGARSATFLAELFSGVLEGLAPRTDSRSESQGNGEAGVVHVLENVHVYEDEDVHADRCGYRVGDRSTASSLDGLAPRAQSDGPWHAVGMEPRAIALLEETRQARGVAETSPESIRVGGGWMCWAEPGSWQNQAMGLGMDGPVRESALDELVAFYEAHDAPARIEVCPHAHASLVSGLRTRGFLLQAFETVLFRRLDAPVEVRWPEGVTVREIDETDEDDLRCYVETLTTGFAADAAETSDPGPARRAGVRVAGHPRVTSFVVEVDGRPAGAASLEIAEPLARLIGASVLPAYRRRGIQSALVQLRMQRGWLAGCTHATVQSRPGGGTERNATRQGFRVACTKVTLERR